MSLRFHVHMPWFLHEILLRSVTLLRCCTVTRSCTLLRFTASEGRIRLKKWPRLISKMPFLSLFVRSYSSRLHQRRLICLHESFRWSRILSLLTKSTTSYFPKKVRCSKRGRKWYSFSWSDLMHFGKLDEFQKFRWDELHLKLYFTVLHIKIRNQLKNFEINIQEEENIAMHNCTYADNPKSVK